jgi:hypothetical protein
MNAKFIRVASLANAAKHLAAESTQAVSAANAKSLANAAKHLADAADDIEQCK